LMIRVFGIDTFDAEFCPRGQVTKIHPGDEYCLLIC